MNIDSYITHKHTDYKWYVIVTFNIERNLLHFWVVRRFVFFPSRAISKSTSVLSLTSCHMDLDLRIGLEEREKIADEFTY